MATIHLIFNSHIDPIWLWPWQAGLDEGIATFRSACDRLDRHPDLVYTQGEAWLHAQVERADPALYKRVSAHIASGRWELTCGWWTQPDCNQPSGRGFERQIELGKRWFMSRHGRFSRIGYNIDSFGHAASLPGYMRAAGQDRYVMMRPSESEMPLPARVFRWRGCEGGPEVTVFRIAHPYGIRDITHDHLRKSLTELPPGVEHTMCFVGLGDHGGGATEEQIAWCRANMDALPGHRLVFSTPERFFDAVAKSAPSLPLVTGELQQHAVGCFSVHRAVKTAVRRSEHLLAAAESLAGPSPALDQAWEKVCSHHFHDTLGGTCIASAYRQAEDQLGHAASFADETIQYAVRTRMSALPDAPLPRIVAVNPGALEFSGYLEHEPWLERRWRDGFSLIDEQGAPVPMQRVHPEAMVGWMRRVVVPLTIPAGGQRVLRLVRGPWPEKKTTAFTISTSDVANDRGCALNVPRTFERWRLGGIDLPSPRLALIEDLSDTWSHGLDRYPDGPGDSAAWSDSALIERGPLMSSLVCDGTIGRSDVRTEWRLYAGQPWAELRLRVHWRERHRVLKLVVPLPGARRGTFGIPGSTLAREPDGRELPLRDLALIDCADNKRLGVICPDIYAADLLPERLRMTLLRSPWLAHHDPYRPTAAAAAFAPVADQGVHEFRFAFALETKLDVSALEAKAQAWNSPPVIADLTRGMPSRFGDEA
jgi:alpha-mannosidase